MCGHAPIGPGVRVFFFSKVTLLCPARVSKIDILVSSTGYFNKGFWDHLKQRSCFKGVQASRLLQSGSSLPPGLNRQEGQCTALGRRPQNRAKKGTDPRTGTQNGKVKLFSADRGASRSSSCRRDVGSALAGLRFPVVPVCCSGWPVLVPCRSWSLSWASLFLFLRISWRILVSAFQGHDPRTGQFF